MNKYIDAYNTMGNSGFELIDFIVFFTIRAIKVCVSDMKKIIKERKNLK